MEILVEGARDLLENMKKTARRLDEIRKEMKESKLFDENLYEEQFKLGMDIARYYSNINNVLTALECDEQTMFIARRLRIQADELAGETKSYDIK